MGNVCFKTQGLGTISDDASNSSENCTTRDANTNGGGEVSTFTTFGPTTSCSECYSTRIASMMANKSEFETELEFRTQHSKVHWSELSHLEGALDSKDQDVDHRQYFEKLQKDVHWGKFCNQVTNVVLGKKLGEGAQAYIYEAQVTFVRDRGSLEEGYSEEGSKCVVKLMKGDCALEDLQRQWPLGVGRLGSNDLLLVLCGALVKEPSTKRNKFGFVMPKFWGDLRNLIDLRMEHKNAKGPPFSLFQAKFLMYWIAQEMSDLHKRGIIHKDLKSSNVLVNHVKKERDIISSNNCEAFYPVIADWECSIGVVGTGWWRAPEILLELKKGIPSSNLKFNEKVDVYNFAMTCYEIATGLTPFEGRPYCSELCDAILNGARPKLPHYLDQNTIAMITSCWDPNPSLRPMFHNIRDYFSSMEGPRRLSDPQYIKEQMQ